VTLVDYKVLIVIQQWLYQTKVYDGAYDAGEAKQRMVNGWRGFQQSVIDDKSSQVKSSQVKSSSL